MKIIFLDVDGVLNSADYFDRVRENRDRCLFDIEEKELNHELNEDKIILLKEIVDKTGAQLVLSSTWRELFGDKEAFAPKDPMYVFLEETLAKYGLKIMSQTPYLNFNRPAEIKAWLDNRVDDVVFVSLDDDFRKDQYAKYGLEHCLVQTSFFEPDGGLRKEHVKQAIKILNGNEVEI